MDLQSEGVDGETRRGTIAAVKAGELEAMTTDELAALFERHGDEFLKFERIANPLSFRPDLHAFLLLSRLVPGAQDMVAGATHDEIFLDVEPEELAAIATESEVIDLIRCGVRLSKDNGLCMFA